MQQYLFLPVAQRLYSEDLGSYQTFGIRAFSAGADVRREAAFVPDVSIDEAFVCALARRCTVLGLSPEHLWDVVRDALA